MTECCVCYTTDPGYLFPTLVSAMQARRNSSPEIADVTVFCIGVSREVERSLARLCDAEGVRLTMVSSHQIENTSAMMARLYLDRIAPPEYRQLLYLDGDTQITGNLDPLLAAYVPRGQFLATKDPLAFSLSSENSEHDKQAIYFRSAGLSPMQGRGYFNSGVLRINRDGWDEIGREAWRLFCSMRNHTKYPDQDALNLAGWDQHIPMSLRWNFPIFLRNAGVEKRIQPRIVHYMGRPKPWHGGFLPWGKAGYQPYLDALRQYPELIPLSEQIPHFRRLKYHGQQHYKRIWECLTWRQGFRNQAMLAYEKCLTLRQEQDISGETLIPNEV